MGVWTADMDIADKLTRVLRGRRLRGLAIQHDPYIWGVVCGKLGLVEYAMATRTTLQPGHSSDQYDPGECLALFVDGVFDAGVYSFEDIAAEVQRLHARWGRQLFRSVLRATVGELGLRRVMGVLDYTPKPRLDLVGLLGAS